MKKISYRYKMTKKTKKKLVEFPLEIFNKIKEIADNEKRSVNSQILYIIENQLSEAPTEQNVQQKTPKKKYQTLDISF